mmetsp:Transcript_115242/g.247712  ORF Transcript_115242/g.247712 Transcript_115242/m.247712 type:complete len:361 (+) Transcript_115242:231-1313(+)
MGSRSEKLALCSGCRSRKVWITPWTPSRMASSSAQTASANCRTASRQERRWARASSESLSSSSRAARSPIRTRARETWSPAAASPETSHSGSSATWSASCPSTERSGSDVELSTGHCQIWATLPSTRNRAMSRSSKAAPQPAFTASRKGSAKLASPGKGWLSRRSETAAASRSTMRCEALRASATKCEASAAAPGERSSGSGSNTACPSASTRSPPGSSGAGMSAAGARVAASAGITSQCAALENPGTGSSASRPAPGSTQSWLGSARACSEALGRGAPLTTSQTAGLVRGAPGRTPGTAAAAPRCVLPAGATSAWSAGAATASAFAAATAGRGGQGAFGAAGAADAPHLAVFRRSCPSQ